MLIYYQLRILSVGPTHPNRFVHSCGGSVPFSTNRVCTPDLFLNIGIALLFLPHPIPRFPIVNENGHFLFAAFRYWVHGIVTILHTDLRILLLNMLNYKKMYIVKVNCQYVDT